MKKSKLINIIISIAAPILLVSAVVLIVSYGWYIRKQQVATIDANAKSMAIDYTFDSDSETNKLRYEVTNLVFFDNNSEFEYPYLSDMAVKLSVHITNKSSNPVSYKLTFSSNKISNTNTVSYVDCLFSEIPTATSTIKTIETARVSNATVTYSNSTTERTAVYDSGNTTIAVDGSLDVPVILYLFGVQENPLALNEQFLYNNGQLVNTYAFTLTIESIPVGEATTVENNSQTNSNDNQDSNDDSGSGETQEP